MKNIMARGAGGRFTGLTEQAKADIASTQLGIEVKIQERLAAAAKELESNLVYSLKGAAFTVMKMARAMIVTAPGASPAGKPPRTRGKAKNLRMAIRYAVERDKLDAVIGPEGPKVGPIGWLHEFGGKRGKGTYPARPYMEPALMAALPNIPQQFKTGGLVGPGT